jgi:hypothetical protein
MKQAVATMLRPIVLALIARPIQYRRRIGIPSPAVGRMRQTDPFQCGRMDASWPARTYAHIKAFPHFSIHVGAVSRWFVVFGAVMKERIHRTKCRHSRPTRPKFLYGVKLKRAPGSRKEEWTGDDGDGVLRV